MPNSKSAKKRLRQSFDRRSRNRTVKSALRTQLRKVREAVEAGNFDEAQKMMPAASSSIDKAASKGVMHRNRAARLKSRLVLTLLKAKSAAA